MAYTKKVYVNGTTPAINGTNLNSTEQGVYDAQLYGSDAGGDDTYVLNLSTTLVEGMSLQMKVTTGNTGACALSIDNGSVSKAIKKPTAGGIIDLVTNDLPAGAMARLGYDGTQWQLQSVAIDAAAFATAAQGTLATNAIPKSTITAAGDTLVGTGASTPSVISKGTAFQQFRMNAGATAQEWGDSTWIKIASAAGAGAASIDFSSIAAGYKYFKIKLNVNLTTAGGSGQLLLRFNNDSGADQYNYSSISQSASTLTGAYAKNTHIDCGSFWGTTYGICIGEILIKNTSASRTKQSLSTIGTVEFNNATGYNKITNGLWKNTANEINQITLVASSDTFATASNVELWGCR